jgi:soluble lytic murein transglycosylase
LAELHRSSGPLRGRFAARLAGARPSLGFASLRGRLAALLCGCGGKTGPLCGCGGKTPATLTEGAERDNAPATRPGDEGGRARMGHTLSLMGMAGKGSLRGRFAAWLAAAWLGVGALLPATAPPASGPEADDGIPRGPGAELRRALEARAAGDAERAEALLAALREREPLVADYADLLRMRMRVEAQRWTDAVSLRETWDHPDSPLEAEFRDLLGRAFAALGDEPAARAAWISALGRTDEAERLAGLRLQIARSQLRSGDERAAAEAFLEVFTRHPGTPADAEAVAALDELEGRIGPLRTARALRRRADALFRERRNEEALAAYDAALAAGGDEVAERILRQRAHTLFRLRRYPEAARAFESFPARTPDLIERARAVARGGDVPAAVSALERIAARSRGAGAAQALLVAALLLDGEGQAERAREHYAELVRSAPRSPAGATALWQLGWGAYRAGHYPAAMGYFEQLAPLEPDELSRLRARYWHARAAAKAGDADTAAEALARIALEYPLSYYGWRASARVGSGAREPVAAASGLPLAGIPPGDAALTPGELARPRILLEAGLEAEARAELDRLFGRTRGLEDRLSLAALYADAGDFHQPQRLVVDAYAEALARAPLADSLDLWWHAWPAPFADEVRDATARQPGVDAALVYSIMREESGYRPRVLSVTGARGLLQLMPETAERVAREQALASFQADDLFVPGVNIALGSAYLGELVGRFHGKPSAAIGSYNAGPHRVAAWLDGGALEDDEWVEAIPYDQTRGYVKRVLRSLHAYRVLY